MVEPPQHGSIVQLEWAGPAPAAVAEVPQLFQDNSEFDWWSVGAGDTGFSGSPDCLG